MLAFYCEGEDINKFMNFLLTDNTFDRFQFRSGEIMTRARFTIDGRYNRDYDNSTDERPYCLWGEIRHNFLDLIKGKKLPAYIKLVLALDEKSLSRLHENAQAAFINIIFEKNRVNFTTGSAQKNFSMDKSLDAAWEDMIKQYFSHLGICIHIQ